MNLKNVKTKAINWLTDHDIDIYNAIMGSLLVGAGVSIGYCFGALSEHDKLEEMKNDLVEAGYTFGMISTGTFFDKAVPGTCDAVNAFIAEHKEETKEMIDSIHKEALGEVLASHIKQRL